MQITVGTEAAPNADNCEVWPDGTDTKAAGFATTVTTDGTKEYGWFFNDARRAAAHSVEVAAGIVSADGSPVVVSAEIIELLGETEVERILDEAMARMAADF